MKKSFTYDETRKIKEENYILKKHLASIGHGDFQIDGNFFIVKKIKPDAEKVTWILKIIIIILSIILFILSTYLIYVS